MKHFSLKLYSILGALFLLSLIGCEKKESELLKETVNEDNLVELSTKMSKDPNFTIEDINLFASAINSNMANPKIYKGKKVGKLIEEEKEKLRKNASSILTDNMNLVEINNSLAFKLANLEAYDKDPNQPINLVTYQFENMYNKDITFIEGFCEVYTKDNKLIKRFIIEINQAIPPKKVLTQPYPYAHDPKNERDVIVRNNIKNLVIAWKPTKITFVGGRELRVKQ